MSLQKRLQHARSGDFVGREAQLVHGGGNKSTVAIELTEIKS